MTIYLLIKRSYDIDDSIDIEEMIAYRNKEDADKAERDFDDYLAQCQILNDEYELLMCPSYPATPERIKQRIKENREAYDSLDHDGMGQWQLFEVREVELK